MKIIYLKELTSSSWSGGITTQLFIFPFTASYKAMNFDFRISKATIEMETSTFSRLPGIQRTLMVLNGSLKLDHHGQRSLTLNQFESDCFQGDWVTTSSGTASDFNLMIRDSSLSGFLKHVRLKDSVDICFAAKGHGFIHIYQGTVLLDNKNELKAGDSIYFNLFDKIELKGKTKVDLILCFIE